MDLFGLHSMLNNSCVPSAAVDPCSSSSSSPSNASSSPHFQFRPSFSRGALSPIEFALNQMPNSSSSPCSSDLLNAFPIPLMPSANVGTSAAAVDHRQFDSELLQFVAHQFGTFSSPSFCGTVSADPSSVSPPLNALLLLLLQQFRALSNAQQNAVSFSSVCPSSVLPLCVPPDFRPLFPTDWTTKSAATNALNCFTSAASSAAFEQHQQICSFALSDFATSSSSSSTGSGSVEHSPGGATKAFDAAGGGGGTAHRLSYPREFKLLVLKSFWANGQNKYRTCKEFQITKSMLNGWLQKADRIKRSRPGSLKSGRSGRRPQFPKIEQQLFEMVQNHLSSGERASNKWIRKVAKKLTTAHTENKRMREETKERVEEGEREARETEGVREQCQFSERWLNNFKRRHGIQTTAECTVNAEGDEDEEAEEDGTKKERRTDEILMEAISPPHSPSPCGPMDELWQDEEQWRSIAWEICARNDRLPIQAFYDRFPKVLQQPSGGGTPKRERNGAKNGH